MILVDLLLVMYVNRMIMMNVTEPSAIAAVRWTMDEYGSEKMRQVARKVVREELLVLGQLRGYGGDGGQTLDQQEEYYDVDNGKTQFTYGYRDDR